MFAHSGAWLPLRYAHAHERVLVFCPGHETLIKIVEARSSHESSPPACPKVKCDLATVGLGSSPTLHRAILWEKFTQNFTWPAGLTPAGNALTSLSFCRLVSPSIFSHFLVFGGGGGGGCCPGARMRRRGTMHPADGASCRPSPKGSSQRAIKHSSFSPGGQRQQQ